MCTLLEYNLILWKDLSVGAFSKNHELVVGQIRLKYGIFLITIWP